MRGFARRRALDGLGWPYQRRLLAQALVSGLLTALVIVAHPQPWGLLFAAPTVFVIGVAGRLITEPLGAPERPVPIRRGAAAIHLAAAPAPAATALREVTGMPAYQAERITSAAPVTFRFGRRPEDAARLAAALTAAGATAAVRDC